MIGLPKSLFICVILPVCCINAQKVNYSTSWFGPNAYPVSLFTDVRIPAHTTIDVATNFYFGHGDFTKSLNGIAELPLLPGKVSIKVWGCMFEHYKVTPAIMQTRKMQTGETSGTATGDVYVQTRILLYSSTDKTLSLILNATLKTASGSGFLQRRYYDTPGYYFDVEAGKSFTVKGKWISEIRLAANLGFLSWETTNSLQNDAPMYGAKIILLNKHWKLENTLAGYFGWMHTHPSFGPDYGDAPLVAASRIIHTANNMSYYAQYQHGINDFPYDQVGLGISFAIQKLTPKY